MTSTPEQPDLTFDHHLSRLAATGAEVAILIDFDECLVTDHRSQVFTGRFDMGPSVDFTDHSTAGIGAMLAGYRGRTKRELEGVAAEIARATEWRTGALDFLSFLAADQRFAPVIVSSGLSIVIEAVCKLSCLSLPTLACELVFDEGNICTGHSCIVSREDKGAFAAKVSDLEAFRLVMAIGHSIGDICMLEQAHGICIPRGCPEAEAVALQVMETFNGITEYVTGVITR